MTDLIDDENLSALLTGDLRMESQTVETITVLEFLKKLRTHPEIAQPAHGLVLQRIKAGGEVDIDAEPLERQGYLRRLKAMRIPTWRVFDHIRGSQRTIARIVSYLESAAANGMQLRQALILIGGPACGKSLIMETIKLLMEGAVVYVIKDCPVHENPINILRLLQPDALASLARNLGMDDPSRGVTLNALVDLGCQPCSYCYRKVMFSENGEAVENPNLAHLQVEAARLSSRTFGISTWSQAEAGGTLIDAIRQGSPGICDMPEMCTVQDAGPGATLQIDALIDATDARRIPDLGTVGGGYLPANVFIAGQANQGSWSAFLEGQKDPDKFTRRMRILSVTYIEGRVEEKLAYLDFLKRMRRKPSFDPLALSMMSTLAVLSRLKPLPSVSPLDKVRLLNGETFIVKRYETARPKQGGYVAAAGGLAAMGMSSSAESDSEPRALTDEEIAEAMKPEEASDERDREGMSGLTMSFMLTFLGELCEAALRAPRNPAFPDIEPTVTALDMIDALRGRLTTYAQSNGLTAKQKSIVQTCLDEHLARARQTSETPGWLEREYRRLLRDQLLEVFSPDFDRRAQEVFEKYVLHAKAYGDGKSTIEIAPRREIAVDTRFLDSVDRGKSLDPQLTSARLYRGSIDAQMVNLKFSKGTLPSEGASEVRHDWTALPELRQAIEDYLNRDIAGQVERLLTTKFDLLDDHEKAACDAALASFRGIGYNPVSLARALEYAKELKLWATARP